MPRVDDARVYAHTVLFFTFSSPLLPSSRLSRYAPDRASLLPFNTCSNKQGVEVENLRTTDSFLLHDETKGKLVWAEVGSDRRKKGRKGEENMETVFWRVPRGRLLFFFFFFFMFINASYVYRFHSSKRDNDTDLCQLSLTIPFRFSSSTEYVLLW